jgi:hypothetical protein
MSKWVWVGLFVAGAALSWGVYVPVVHRATDLLKSNMRAFLMVGLAYFLVAVLVPALFIWVLGDPTQKPGVNFEIKPMLFGLWAGTAGALGALFVIFASREAGPLAPYVVAPLVFAGAPIINVIATITYFHPVKTPPDWRFFLGLVLAAAGAAMVMIYKPTDPKPHAAAKPAPTTVAPPAQG